MQEVSTYVCVACGSTSYTIARKVYAPVVCNVLQCARCRLLWREAKLNNLYGKSSIGKQPYYERVAAARQRLWKDILPKLEPYRKTNRILDIGSGTGGFLVAAKEAGWEVEGIEPSPVESAYSRERLGLNVRTGVFEPGLFEGGLYDAVTLWNVLDHFSEPLEGLIEIHRLLRPGGILAFRVPNGALHLAMHRLSLMLGKKDLSVFPNYSFSHTSLKKILVAAGFSKHRILNAVPSSGDPYKLFSTLGGRVTDLVKRAIFSLSQILHYASGGRILAAPSYLAFAWKE